MRRDTLKVLALLGLGSLALWLWTSRSGGSAARRAGVLVAEAVTPLLDKAKSWLSSAESKANLLALWPAITKAADAVGMPPLVLARVVYIESGYRSDVIEGRKLGDAGEVGLTQVIAKYHPTIDLRTPEAQLMGTARDMAADFARFGTWPAAVAAWNAGPGAVASALKAGDAWRSKLPAITQDYLTKLDRGLA